MVQNWLLDVGSFLSCQILQVSEPITHDPHMIHTWLSTKFSGMYPHVYNFILNWSHLGLQLSAFSSLNSSAYFYHNNILLCILHHEKHVICWIPQVYVLCICSFTFNTSELLFHQVQWAMIKQASEKQKIYLQNKWDIHIAVIPNTHAALIPHTVDIWVKYPR